MKPITKLSIILMLVGAALSCQEEVPVEIEPGTYGKSTSVTISSEAGTKDIAVTSNGQWKASLGYDTATWASIEGENTGNGNGKVTVKYRANNGLIRQGMVLVSSNSKATIDTVFLNQYGIEPSVAIEAETLNFSCVAGADSTLFDTNVPVSEFEHFTVATTWDEGGEGWLTPILRDDLGRIVIKVDENTKFAERKATVTITYKDEWGNTHSTSTRITQGIPGGTESTVLKSFQDVRNLLTADGEMVIQDDISIEGLVVSDRDGRNMGETIDSETSSGDPASPTATYKGVDYTVDDTTVYLENEDGSLGFRIITSSIEANQTVRFAKTKLWLKGLTLKRESNPVRYTLSGVQAEHYISSIVGTAADIPVKNRYIRDLKDEDIYTYVTLKKCEYPIRRGMICLMNYGYRARQAKLASVVADIHGDWIYQIFNSLCPWINNFPVPQGQGKVSGILVHEQSHRYNPDSDQSLGRYQIRSCNKADIQVTASAKDSYTTVITEWADNASDGHARRVHPDPSFNIDDYPPATYWGIEPTYGKGFFYHCKGLWPVITSGYCHPSDYTKTVGNAIYGFNTWWDAAAGEPNYAVWRFSTKGLSGSFASLAFTTRHHSQTSPPFWNVEYSIDEGATWKKVGDEFFIPPTATWSPKTQFHQISGEKPNFYALPAEILGHDVAMVRIIPSRDMIESATGWNNGGPLSKNNGYLDICYSAIRYKK